MNKLFWLLLFSYSSTGTISSMEPQLTIKFDLTKVEYPDVERTREILMTSTTIKNMLNDFKDKREIVLFFPDFSKKQFDRAFSCMKILAKKTEGEQVPFFKEQL